MPDSKENKQADAGSRLLSKAFSVRRVVVERVVFTVCCGAEQVGSTERHNKEPLLTYSKASMSIFVKIV